MCDVGYDHFHCCYYQCVNIPSPSIPTMYSGYISSVTSVMIIRACLPCTVGLAVFTANRSRAYFKVHFGLFPIKYREIIARCYLYLEYLVEIRSLEHSFS